MCPECRLLHEEVNAFNWIEVKETGVIMVTKLVWIGQTLVTHFARFPSVHARHVGHFIQPVEYRVRLSEVADSYYHQVPEILVNSSSADVVIGAPVC